MYNSPLWRKKKVAYSSWAPTSSTMIYGTLEVRVYNNLTHTNQYLNWDSNHHLEHKGSLLRDPGCNKLVSDPHNRDTDIHHVNNGVVCPKSKPLASMDWETPKRGNHHIAVIPPYFPSMQLLHTGYAEETPDGSQYPWHSILIQSSKYRSIPISEPQEQNR